MTQSSFPFDGAVALVTGAASGIGQALVAALQAQGVKVAGADLSAPAGPDLALALDIRSRSDWAAAADRVGETFGGADLLFNVAGICASPQPIHEVELETFQRVLDTNLVGMFHGTQVFVNQLRRTGRSAHIVNICSVCGLFSTPGYAAYAASKTATVSLSETARSDLAPLGIGVTAVCPGYVNTAIASSGQDSTSENRRRVAEIMANSMQPEEVAGSGEAGYDPRPGRHPGRVFRRPPRGRHRRRARTGCASGPASRGAGRAGDRRRHP